MAVNPWTRGQGAAPAQDGGSFAMTGMPVGRVAARRGGLRDAAALLALAALLAGAGFWLGGRAAAQRSHDAAARSARVRADVARRVSRHPSAKYAVRQAVASGRFGPAHEAGIGEAFAAAAARYPRAVRAAALGRSYSRFLSGLVLASFKDQPQKWQADLNAYAAKLEKDANASRPLPAWVAPYAPFLPPAAWGVAALLGLVGAARLIAARPSVRLRLRLPALPKREPKAAADEAQTADAAVPAPPAVAASRLERGGAPSPTPDPAAIAVAAAAAAEAIRADYEAQVENLRRERNEARRHLLILKGRLEKAEQDAATTATPSAPAAEAAADREEKETLARHLQVLQGHVAELEEAFRQADFRAQTAEMRASQLTGEVTDLEETLFLRAAELREARRLADEMRRAASPAAPVPSSLSPEEQAESARAEAGESIEFDLKDILGTAAVTFDTSAYDLTAADFDRAATSSAGDAPEAATAAPESDPVLPKRSRTPRAPRGAVRLTVAGEPPVAEAAAKGGGVGEIAAVPLPQSADASPPSLGAFPPRTAAP